MANIKLRDFYPWYTQDEYIEVPDEIAEELRADKRYEAAYPHRVTYHKAQYSLDCNDGIEYFACLHVPTHQEVLDMKEWFFLLWTALNSLPEIQGRRVDAHIILDKTYLAIAWEESADNSAVRRSVLCKLANMRKYLQKNL